MLFYKKISNSGFDKIKHKILGNSPDSDSPRRKIQPLDIK